MNVGRFASDLSFILIQQPSVLIRVFIYPIAGFILSIFMGHDPFQISEYYSFLFLVILLEGLLIFSLLTSHFSNGDLLVAT